ncbi:CocE/NonD family hydrolase [Planctomycetota bacterium]
MSGRLRDMRTKYRTYLIVEIIILTLSCSILTGSEAEELGVKIERNVPVKMRDGTILRADVHRPDRGGPYPVLVQRTPYDKGGGL